MASELKILLVTVNDKVKKKVDDLVATLERCLFEIVSDALEALDKIKDTDYNLILLDTNLPAIDGVTTLKILNKIRPHIKVCLLADKTDLAIVDKAKEAIAVRWLFKPISTEEIKRIISGFYPQKIIPKDTLVMKL